MRKEKVKLDQIYKLNNMKYCKIFYSNEATKTKSFDFNSYFPTCSGYVKPTQIACVGFMGNDNWPVFEVLERKNLTPSSNQNEPLTAYVWFENHANIQPAAYDPNFESNIKIAEIKDRLQFLCSKIAEYNKEIEAYEEEKSGLEAYLELLDEDSTIEEAIEKLLERFAHAEITKSEAMSKIQLLNNPPL